MDKNWDRDATRFLDELQAAIILAGGAKPSLDRLAGESINRLLKTIYPNGIRLKVIPRHDETEKEN